MLIWHGDSLSGEYHWGWMGEHDHVIDSTTQLNGPLRRTGA